MSERISKVKIGISRTLNTAQYESLQITVETTDEINWDSVEERNKKIDNINQLLVDKYSDIQLKVLKELGCSEKAAWLSQNRSTTTRKVSEPPRPAINVTDGKFDTL